jgi:hypothetical protein
VKFPIVTEMPISTLLKEHFENAENFKAIIEPVKKLLFSVVSSDYELIRHEELIATVREVLRAEIGMGNLEEEIKLTHNGARLYATWWFRDTIEVVEGDEVRWGIRATNSYDASMGIFIELQGLRYVCSNGMTLPGWITKAKRKHLGAKTLDDVEAKLQQVLNNLEIIEKTLVDNAKIEVPLESALAIIEDSGLPKIYQETAKRQLLIIPLDHFRDVPQAGTGRVMRFLKLWDVYNALTWAITHINPDKDEKTRIEMERRVAPIIMGE